MLRALSLHSRAALHCQLRCFATEVSSPGSGHGVTAGGDAGRSKSVQPRGDMAAVRIDKKSNVPAPASSKPPSKCGPENTDDDDEMEDMFIQGPAGVEWGGPTRGGRRPEPTRYGDWERKGRASDF